MKKGVIVGHIQRLLAGLRFECLADVGLAPARLGAFDAAVLKVAMMVAALDGNVTDAELKAFERLARKCRGCDAESAKAVFRDGLRSAGYVELAARTLKDKELVATFVDEAKSVLPGGFAFADAKDVRRAFVMWMAMAMSDGDYSPNERKAIGFFARSVSAQAEARRAASAMNVRNFSPAFVMAYSQRPDKATELSAAFFEEAERLIAGLGREVTAPAAAKALKALVLNGTGHNLQPKT